MEHMTEVFFMAVGAIMFCMAVTLLIHYNRLFDSAYERLFDLTESEYVILKEWSKDE